MTPLRAPLCLSLTAALLFNQLQAWAQVAPMQQPQAAASTDPAQPSADPENPEKGADIGQVFRDTFKDPVSQTMYAHWKTYNAFPSEADKQTFEKELLSFQNNPAGKQVFVEERSARFRQCADEWEKKNAGNRRRQAEAAQLSQAMNADPEQWKAYQQAKEMANGQGPDSTLSTSSGTLPEGPALKGNVRTKTTLSADVVPTPVEDKWPVQKDRKINPENVRLIRNTMFGVAAGSMLGVSIFLATPPGLVTAAVILGCVVVLGAIAYAMFNLKS